MGMGYFPNSATTISIEGMEELLPNEMANLIRVAEEEEQIALEDLFFEQEADMYPKAEEALINLQKAFRELTTVGSECLEIYPAYHDSSEEGDRYDDVDGAFFTVDNALVMSEPAKKFQKYLVNSHWVSFG